MSPSEMTVGVSHVAVAILIIVLCTPLYRGRIRMNRRHGVRFPQSFVLDENWYAINRYGARVMMLWSVALLIVGAVVCFLPLQRWPIGAIGLVSMPVVCVVIPTIQSYVYGRRLPRADDCHDER